MDNHRNFVKDQRPAGFDPIAVLARFLVQKPIGALLRGLVPVPGHGSSMHLAVKSLALIGNASGRVHTSRPC